MSGKARIPSQSSTTGVREFEQLLLLAGNNGFAALLSYLGRVEP